MHLKLLRVAASTALCGGIVTLGLVPTQAALATTPTYINVPCSTTALITDMTSPANNTVLNLWPGCTYVLDNTSGPLPSVTTELTINGHGATIKRSYASGTNSFSIFVVSGSNGDLTLRNLNVVNGGGPDTYDGGAIDIDNTSAYAQVYGGTFRDNNTYEYGGAISNHGTLTVDGTKFDGNSSAYGGAVSSYGTTDSATLDDVTFSHNYASEDGGAVYNNDNDMTIRDSFFKYNHAYDGGAIYNYYDLLIVHSQFGMNSASYGGALYNDDSVEVDTSLMATNFAKYNGGAIYNNDTTPTLVADLINLNLPNQCYPVGTIPGCVG
jgi:predicted outer membrane repeat protein